MLGNLRGTLAPTFEKIGKVASRTGIPPFGWTLLGLLSSLLSGISFSGFLLSNVALGGLLLLVSGVFDTIDGAVARTSNKVSKIGAFMDSTLDRLGEVSVFVGILAGRLTEPILVMLTLSFSLLTSYTRARGESLGIEMSGVGIGERAERLLVLAVASIFNYIFFGMLIVFVLAVITSVHRIYYASKALKN